MKRPSNKRQKIALKLIKANHEYKEMADEIRELIRNRLGSLDLIDAKKLSRYSTLRQTVIKCRHELHEIDEKAKKQNRRNGRAPS